MKTLTPTELQMLKDLQQKGQNLIIKLGEIEIAKISLEENRKNAKLLLSELKEEELSFERELIGKYGTISVNPKTGVITKIEE